MYLMLDKGPESAINVFKIPNGAILLTMFFYPSIQENEWHWREFLAALWWIKIIFEIWKPIVKNVCICKLAYSYSHPDVKTLYDVWDYKVPIKLKGKLYRTAIRPSILYGSDDNKKSTTAKDKC